MNVRIGTSVFVLAMVAVGSPTVAQPDGGGGGPPPTPVRVEAVQREQLQERRRVTGELRPVARSNVATIEPGRVVSRSAEEGRRVRAGDLLAVLDSRRLVLEERWLKARARVAQATIEARTADVDMLRRDVETLTRLDERSASNPKELADARSELEAAEANLEAARQDLEVIEAEANITRIRLEDTNIKAPFDGVVVATLTEKGQWVAEGDPIVELLSTGAHEAWLDVPQRFAPALMGRNAHVQITIDALERTMPPAVPVTVPNVDPTARTFQIFVRLVEPALAPGMSVTGWVPTGERASFLTVSRNAVMRNDTGPYVYVARSMGEGPYTATPTPVTIMFESGQRSVIRAGGIDEGDFVVVEGNERLFPMMPISFDAPSPRAATPGDAPRAARTAGPDGGR